MNLNWSDCMAAKTAAATVVMMIPGIPSKRRCLNHIPAGLEMPLESCIAWMAD